jgi:CubicO group peptidase (beta-lactamase class C family)
VVAGRVISNVTGHSWAEELFSRILKPLDMTHSGTSALHLQEISDISLPYAKIRGNIQKLPFLYPCSTLAAMAMYSSISDMIKWVRIQLFDQNRPGFIQNETLNDMHTIHMPYSLSEPSGYGLGWEIDTYRNRKRVHHGGIIEGSFSYISLLPEEKMGLVILTNSSTDGRYAISQIEKNIYNLLLESEEIPTLQKYVGDYKHPAYGTLHISIEDDSLLATLGRMRVQLNQKAEGVFEAKYSALLAYGIDPLVEFSFFCNSLGEVDELRVPFEHFRSAPPILFRK